MSNDVTKLCRPLRLSPTQKAVLMCLADYCHDDGVDWHSVAALQEWTCLGRTTVLEALKGLEKRGLVKIERRFGAKSTTTVQLAAIEAEMRNQSVSRTGAAAEPVRDADRYQSTGRTGAADEPVRLADATGTAPVQTGTAPVPEALEASEASKNLQTLFDAPDGAAQSGFSDSSEIEVRFLAFWEAYPRKVARQDALKAFSKLKPSEALLGQLLQALQRQKASPDWHKEHGRFIPHAATWLNGRRWEDQAPKRSAEGAARLLDRDDYRTPEGGMHVIA